MHHHAKGFLDLTSIVFLVGLPFLCLISMIVLRLIIALCLKLSLLKRANLERFLMQLLIGSTVSLLLMVVTSVLLHSFGQGEIFIGPKSPPFHIALALASLGVFLLFPGSLLLWFGQKARVPLIFFPPANS